MKTYLFEEHSSVLLEWIAARPGGHLLVLDSHFDFRAFAASEIDRLSSQNEIGINKNLISTDTVDRRIGQIVDIGNFLSACMLFGCFDKVTVVTPSLETYIAPNFDALINRSLKRAGANRRLAIFEVYGGTVEIVRFDQLVRLDDISWVDIDLDFFFDYQRKIVWTQVSDVLEQLPYPSHGFSACRSVTSGYLGLREMGLMRDLLDWGTKKLDFTKSLADLEFGPDDLFFDEGFLRFKDERREFIHRCKLFLRSGQAIDDQFTLKIVQEAERGESDLSLCTQALLKAGEHDVCFDMARAHSYESLGRSILSSILAGFKLGVNYSEIKRRIEFCLSNAECFLEDLPALAKMSLRLDDWALAKEFALIGLQEFPHDENLKALQRLLS
ncbi:MAG: UPF0489 family protein [Rhodobacteraceae bacterium]|nr:UPF0489 family protein [Paracoccaceae bacterium]